MAKVTRTEGKPHDRLTEICDSMIRVFEAEVQPEEEIKCIVFLQGPKAGGMVLEGYDDDTDAMVDLLMHLRAIFQANGKELIVAPVMGVG